MTRYDACNGPECDRPRYAKGLCRSHYQQWLRGRSLTPLRKSTRGMPMDESLATWSEPAAGGCRTWTGAISSDGYGRIYVDGRSQYAHRVAYELACGPIPEGSEVDHTCHVSACVEPGHLRLATPSQNQQNRRGAASNSITGVRGVHRRGAGYVAQVTLNGRIVFSRYFSTLEKAEASVIEARRDHFTHTQN